MKFAMGPRNYATQRQIFPSSLRLHRGKCETGCMALLVVAERMLPERGGLAVATSRVVAAAALRGETVHSAELVNDTSPGMRSTREAAGHAQHRIGALPREDESLAAFSAHLREIVRAERVDLVHSMYAGAAAYAATLVARELGIPSIVSVRGNDVDRGLYHTSDLPRLDATLRRATLLTGVSQKLCDTVARTFDRPVDHVSNSVDAEAFVPLQADENIQRTLEIAEGAVIAFVGELREKKGIRFLLPAFADVLRRRPATLLLIGGVREDSRAALESFQERAPEAAARVRILPYERDPTRLSKLLALADVLVFPSLWEGTPNAVLECMAAARLVLATRVGGHIDLIEHGVTGALFDVSELDRLPATIEEVLDLPLARREALGKNAREFVRKRHAPAAESHAYAALYSRARMLRL